MKARARNIRKHLPTAVLVLALIAGVCLIAYPTVSDWWNQLHASRAAAGYSQVVEELSTEELSALRSEAQAYNKSLAGKAASYNLSDSEEAAYERLLCVPGTDVMATVSIPAINMTLPIYHGTSEGILQIGVGHLAGSSLPVGGESTHSVLVGHRGLPSAKLFTNLDRLAVGDTFSLTCLGEVMYYEVDQVLIVEPDDTSALAIEEGKDLCTLLTCTPYGVNTHRLLVRGHRVDAPSSSAYVTADAYRVEPALVACVLAAPVLVMLSGAVVVRERRRARRRAAAGLAGSAGSGAQVQAGSAGAQPGPAGARPGSAELAGQVGSVGSGVQVSAAEPPLALEGQDERDGAQP